MQRFARTIVAKRWLVIAGWLGFIIAAQLIASAAGGSSYKDVFTLPHTETQKVLDLLKANGRNGLNGQVGTMVVHAKSGTLSAVDAPAGLDAALAKLCASGNHVSTIASPWYSASCDTNTTSTGDA